MSRSFTKLFSSITESTVWAESPSVRVCWITMLAMADRRGRVWASVPGLAHRARIDMSECQRALALFLSPDPYSRTKDHDGRRIEEIDGGWRLLNYEKYRDIRDEEGVLESKRHYIARRREHERSRSNTSTVEHGRNESNEAESESESEKPLSERGSPSASPDPEPDRSRAEATAAGMAKRFSASPDTFATAAWLVETFEAQHVAVRGVPTRVTPKSWPDALDLAGQFPARPLLAELVDLYLRAEGKQFDGYPRTLGRLRYVAPMLAERLRVSA